MPERAKKKKAHPASSGLLCSTSDPERAKAPSIQLALIRTGRELTATLKADSVLFAVRDELLHPYPRLGAGEVAFSRARRDPPQNCCAILWVPLRG
jgi:hypothetical protein